jgi:cyclic pyranopterin phosphate synthase
VAELAGIMAAKRTSELIPLCHPVPISEISVALSIDPSIPGIHIMSTVKAIAKLELKWKPHSNFDSSINGL